MGAVINLYKSTDLGFDLDTNRPVFQSSEKADAFMSGRASRTYRSSNFNRIGDPMLLPVPYSEAAGYDIGTFVLETGPNQLDGTTYWFRIRDVVVNETNRTEALYDIDYLMTYMYYMKKGHIDRVPAGHMYAKPKPVSPRYWDYTARCAMHSGIRVAFILKQMKTSSSAQSYDIQGPVYNVIEGAWFYLGQDNKIHGVNLIAEASERSGRFALTDVVNAWIIPQVGTMTAGNLEHWEDGPTSTHVTAWKMINSTGLAHWEVTQRLTNVPAAMIGAEVQGGLLKPSDTAEGRLMGVCDERGNVVWTFPDRKIYGFSVSYGFRMSMASCEVDIAFRNPVDDLELMQSHLQDDMFTYSCRPVDVMGDSWQDYLFRQRDADIQNRKMQNEAGLVGGVANAGSGALMGAAMGSVVPGLGTVAGAIAGGLTSIVGSAVNYGVQSYYGDKMQGVTDRVYQLAQDTVAVNGMITSTAISFGIILYLFCLEADGTSMELIENSNEVEGVPADAFALDMFSELCYVCDVFTPAAGDFAPFAGVCEVDFPIPTGWKKTVSAQLAAGARYRKFGTWA